MYSITTLRDPPKEARNDIPGFLPQPPFRLLVVCPSGGGKSLILGNMLSKDQFGYTKVFKHKFMFSPTYGLDDPSWHGVKFTQVFDTYDEAAIDGILNDQRRIIAKKGKPRTKHVLFVFDDMLTSLPQARQSSLVSLAFHGRHLKISFIITCQAYRACPRPIRMNATHFIILRVNKLEEQAIAEEQPINNFESVYSRAVADPWSFLYINQTVPVPERYWIRFDEQIKEIQ